MISKYLVSLIEGYGKMQDSPLSIKELENCQYKSIKTHSKNVLLIDSALLDELVEPACEPTCVAQFES